MKQPEFITYEERQKYLELFSLKKRIRQIMMIVYKYAKVFCKTYVINMSVYVVYRIRKTSTAITRIQFSLQKISLHFSPSLSLPTAVIRTSSLTWNLQEQVEETAIRNKEGVIDPAIVLLKVPSSIVSIKNLASTHLYMDWEIESKGKENMSRNVFSCNFFPVFLNCGRSIQEGCNWLKLLAIIWY